MNDHIKGGQGRTASEIEAGGYVMLFTLAAAACIVALLVVNRCVGGAS